MIFGIETCIPNGAKARVPPHASIVGRMPVVLVATSRTKATGENAGFVVKLSSAAITYWRESSLPNFALIVCSK